ncbi:MAG: hypothetical protein GY710_20185 [Desulfobacteraceae bacterium]|nr:hypothetical protein [Desulfobacteraceae bacterium]
MPRQCYCCKQKLLGVSMMHWRSKQERPHRCRYCGRDVCDACSQYKMHSDYIKNSTIPFNDKSSYVRVCKVCSKMENIQFLPLKQFMTRVFPRFDVFILGHLHQKTFHPATSFLVHLLNRYHDQIGECAVFLESHFGDRYADLKGALNYTDSDVAKKEFRNALNRQPGSNKEDPQHDIMQIMGQCISNQTTDLHIDCWNKLGHPEYSALGMACKNLEIPVFTYDDDLTMIQYKRTTDPIAREQLKHFHDPSKDKSRHQYNMRQRANKMIGHRVSRTIEEF